MMIRLGGLDTVWPGGIRVRHGRGILREDSDEEAMEWLR